MSSGCVGQSPTSAEWGASFRPSGEQPPPLPLRLAAATACARHTSHVTRCASIGPAPAFEPSEEPKAFEPRGSKGV
eukprot:45959-Chlamydomonas_euryale.AAC.1